MNIEMCPLEIVGLKSNLSDTIQVLRDLGYLHIDELIEAPEISARPLTLDREILGLQEELSFLVARIEGLLDELGESQSADYTLPVEECLAETRTGLGELCQIKR